MTDQATATVKLTRLERRALAIIYPVGTVAHGREVHFDLELRGFVRRASGWRYEITPAGAAAIRQYPESEWKIGPAMQRQGFRR